MAEAAKGAPDLAKEHHPVGSKTGVELDYMLAKAGAETLIPGKPESTGKLQNRLIFMAHYDVPGKIEDVQLVKIAMDGYMDMLANAKQYNIHKDDLPSVMTVFHWGKELIIASSQKGGQALTYTRDNAVTQLVDRCIAPAEKSNDAKCGEMSAAQLYQRLHPNVPIASQKITTVTVISGKRNNAYSSTEDDVKVWPPCSKEEVSPASVTRLIAEHRLTCLNNRAVAVTRLLERGKSLQGKLSQRYGTTTKGRLRTPQQAGIRLLWKFCLSLHPCRIRVVLTALTIIRHRLCQHCIALYILLKKGMILELNSVGHDLLISSARLPLP